jgi:hypothetical protein
MRRTKEELRDKLAPQRRRVRVRLRRHDILELKRELDRRDRAAEKEVSELCRG